MGQPRKGKGKHRLASGLDQTGIRAMLRQFICERDEGPVTEVLRSVVKLGADPGADLARLAAYDADPQVSELATVLVFAGAKDDTVPNTVRRKIRQGAKPVLLAALQDASLADERKVNLGTLHTLCGGKMSTEEYHACFQDFATAAQRVVERSTERISEQPGDVESVLEPAGFVPEPDGDERPTAERFESLIAWGMTVSAKAPAVAATVVSSAAAVAAQYELPDDLLEKSLETIAETRCDKAAWCLNELGRWPGLGAIAAKASGLAVELISAGLVPRFSLLSEFSHALITSVDGIGSRSLVIFARTMEGGLDSLNLLLNDAAGIKDAWSVYGEASRVEESLREHPMGVRMAPCSEALARELVGDALAIHEELDTLPPGRFFIGRPYLGRDPIPIKRRTPNLGSYMLELLPHGPQMFKDCEELIKDPHYGDFYCASDAAYDFVRTLGPRRRKLSKAQLEAFMRDIAMAEKDQLLARVAVTLEVESWAGRATQKMNRIAARVYAGLLDEAVPFHENPYVQRLSEKAIRSIGESIRLGFRNQAEANAAAMRHDDDLSGLMDDLLGE